MNQTYFRVSLHVDAAEESSIVAYLMEQGALGVSQNLAYQQPELQYDPILLPTKNLVLDAYFKDKPSAHLLEELGTRFGVSDVALTEEPEQDWLAEWKKDYRSFPLTRGGFWVVPSWLESPVGVAHTIRIDPGMAFGTGTHATTQMAAQLIEDLTSHYHPQSRHRQNPLSSLLDVGTGTGILAILAERLGFTEVWGIDLDPEAIRVSEENRKLNQGPQILFTDTPLAEVPQIFQVVVANIIDGVLIKLRDDLLKKVTRPGYLILSGILLDHEDSFWERFVVPSPLKLISRLESDGWVALLFEVH